MVVAFALSPSRFAATAIAGSFVPWVEIQGQDVVQMVSKREDLKKLIGEGDKASVDGLFDV